jgi:methionyl-tRNA synthetase
MGQGTFYITTPIYYVNDKPHIGHAYTTVLADVLTRFQRLLGRPAFFLTGTDEHGQKVQEAANARGVPPQQHVDETVQRFQELWKRLDITHDDFIRTTEPRHTRVVQALLQDLYDRGEIYQADYDGLYDVRSETFITEKDIPEGARLEDLPHIKRIRETNYFFRMSKYQDWLIRHIQANPRFIRPESRRNETLGFLQKPLQDLCISRPKSRLAWGIELPFDRDYVCYVWFDALVNYISAVGYGSDPATFARWWPASFHLIGKDILTTHTVYWPTMLQAAGIPQPETIFAHGWWLSGADKMSKSLGNVVNPLAYADRAGVDAFRYFLMAEMALGQDASFTDEIFVKRTNSDLANDLGNLVSRALKLLETHRGRAAPTPPPDLLERPEERALWDRLAAAPGEVDRHLDAMRVDLAVGEVLAAVRDTNKFFGLRKPWETCRTDPTTFDGTLYLTLEALRVCASLLTPVMPGKMAAILRALGLPETPAPPAELRRFGGVPAGQPLGDPGNLFPRLEKTPVNPTPIPAPSPVPPSAAPTPPPSAPVGVIAYDDFAKVKLRTARVLTAEKVPNADKLLQLSITLGEGEERTIVAGIAQHYTPEQIVGKTIVVVANLAPAKIRGIASNGMLLAATGPDGALRVVTVDGELPPGAPVK